MKVITDWINSHKILTVCIALFLLIVQPFLVHLFLKIPAPSPFFVHEWNAGDLLTYIAGFEAFLGTVFLGIVAVRQNDKANELNEQMLCNEQKRDLFARRPFIMISDIRMEECNIDDVFENCNNYCIHNDFSPQVFTDSCALCYSVNYINATTSHIDFKVLSLSVVDFTSNTIYKKYTVGAMNEISSQHRLSPSETHVLKYVVSHNDAIAYDSKWLRIELALRNTVGESYQENIELYVLGTNPDDFSFHNVEYEFVKCN